MIGTAEIESGYMSFGKAISGGTPIGADEITRMNVEHLTALKARLALPSLEQTDDLLNQRVAEELDYTRRLLESVEAELVRRGIAAPTIARVEEAEQMLTDLSSIVDAKDRCAGVQRAATPNLKKRLLRRGLDGKATVCDNQ